MTGRAILVGSRAADLRGALPPWRGGQMIDWDIHADRDVVEAFASRHPGYERADDAIGGVHFLDGRGLRVSFFPWDETSDALWACDDNTPTVALGLPSACISIMSQIALKAAYCRVAGPHAEKNDRDLDFWLSAGGSDWKPCHDRVFDTMTRRASLIFNTATPAVRPIFGDR